MKENKNQKHNLDQLFKEGLNDFQVPAPGGLRPADDSPIDEAFKDGLQSFEATPTPEVWDKVKTKIPLNLKVKRQLTWWTKVAAALILGLAATVALKEYQDRSASEFVNETMEQEAVPAIPIESDFVYQLRNKGKDDSNKTDQESAREILNDDEVIVEARDLDILPVEPLETKVEGVVSTVENPLDDQQRSSKDLGEIPLRTVNTTDIESLSLTEKEKVKEEKVVEDKKKQN